MALTPVQALLRTPGLADNLPGLPLTPRAQGVADSGPVAIVQGGLDEGAAHVRVASLGQRSPTLRVARGILTGHRPEIGHELPRTLEPLEVHHLDQEDHGRQGVDPAEAPQPADRVAVRRGLRQGFDLVVQFGEAGERLLERKERGLEGPLPRRQVETLIAEPAAEPPAAVLCPPVDAPVAGPEL